MWNSKAQKMISSVRVKKLFAYLVPLLGNRSKAELDDIYAEIEKLLGYDARKASRLRHDARERDNVVDAIMRFNMGRSTGVLKPKAPPPRMSMPENTKKKI